MGNFNVISLLCSAACLLGISGGVSAVEILNSYANDRGTFDASTNATSAVTVKCLSVTGASSGGITPHCYIGSPGYNRLLPIGHSIGTTGPGLISLGCVGNRAPGRTLSCSAEVNANSCQATKNVSAYLENGGTYPETAPVSASSATVRCTSAYSFGHTAKCYVQTPSYNGILDVGQSIGVAGPGTVIFSCNGSYSSRLSCEGRVTQTCP